jgi:acetylornithine deacetylase/succinyl-diaminopimelate desuccinylase-like protein
MAPGEDTTALLESLRRVIDDPAVRVEFSGSASRPQTGIQRLDSEGFKAIEAAVTRHYNTVTLPTMSTGATDMAYVREKGTQCYGIGPAIDFEDGPKGFGAHSDQERILETELHRFVRFQWDVVEQLARARRVP